MVSFRRKIRVEIEGSDSNTVVENLRITFNLTTETGSGDGGSEVVLYNVVESTRNRILDSADGGILRLFAGYELSDRPLDLLYDGEIEEVKAEREDRDRMMRINLVRRGIFLESVAKPRPYSFDTSRTLRDAILLLFDTNNLTVSLLGSEFLDEHHVSEYSYTGPLQSALEHLLQGTGLKAAITNVSFGHEATIEITLESVPLAPSQTGLETISRETGLIGSPSPTDDGVEVVTLLNPRLRIRYSVDVVSEFITGRFRIQKIDHKGDNWGGEFQSSFVGKEVPSSVIDSTSAIPESELRRELRIP